MLRTLLYWIVVVPGRLRLRVVARLPRRRPPDSYWSVPGHRIRLWLR